MTYKCRSGMGPTGNGVVFTEITAADTQRQDNNGGSSGVDERKMLL